MHRSEAKSGEPNLFFSCRFGDGFPRAMRHLRDAPRQPRAPHSHAVFKACQPVDNFVGKSPMSLSRQPLATKDSLRKLSIVVQQAIDFVIFVGRHATEIFGIQGNNAANAALCIKQHPDGPVLA